MTLKERVVEVSYRFGSLEVNEASSTVRGIRVHRGSWLIVSSQDGASWDRLAKLLESASSRAPAGGGEALAEAKLYDGVKVLGEAAEAEELVDKVSEVVGLAGRESEVVLLHSRRVREIRGDGFHAVEEKNAYELLVSVRVRSGAAEFYGSSGLALTGSLKQLDSRVLKELVETAWRRAGAQARAKDLDPLSRGRWTLILQSEAAAAFFHEVAHMLEGDRPDSLRYGTRVSTMSLTLVDDPFHPFSPAYSVFDDEGVEANRKTLVEGGEVVSLLHTRESLYRASREGTVADRPGNARGLFHRPKAMHSTLVVRPGDWRDEEMVEESKKALLVDGVVRADLGAGVVTLVPEAVHLVEKGEVRRSVRVRYVQLPVFKALTSLDALGRSVRLRYSYEKGHLVAEASPAVRLVGYAF